MNEREFIYWLAGVMDANAGNNFITEKLVEVIRKKLAKFVEQQEPSPLKATVLTATGPQTQEIYAGKPEISEMWPKKPVSPKW
jgi:hypothetical protein